MEIEVDTTGKTCPYPLINMRKAVLKANEGDIISIKGDHPQSFEEIKMGAGALGCEVEEAVNAGEKGWRIRIKVKKQ